jgi:glycerophosphoryl diester phosphodiesterase
MPKNTHNFLCFAHRGASGHEPENTVASFDKAIELGASWIELDVRVVESQAIVFHDRNLKRMTGTEGLVSKQTLRSIQALNLPKGLKIPLLRDILGAYKDRVNLQIELKGSGTGLVVAEELNAALTLGWKPESLLVSSFDHAELLTFKTLAPLIPRGVLVYGYPLNCIGIARKLAAISIHLSMDSVSKERITRLKQSGFKVYVYTVDDPADIKLLSEWGADGVFSNFPERVLGLN